MIGSERWNFGPGGALTEPRRPPVQGVNAVHISTGLIEQMCTDALRSRHAFKVERRDVSARIFDRSRSAGLAEWCEQPEPDRRIEQLISLGYTTG